MWKASLYVTLSLGLVIVLVASALRPTLITIAELVGQLEQNQSLEEQMDEKIALIHQARQVYSQNEARFAVLDEALPAGSEWSRFAAGVEQMATDSGLLLKSISIGPLYTAKAAEGVAFTLQADGTYDQIKGFVAGLKNSRRLALISKVSISKSKEGLLSAGISGTLAAGEEAGK